MVEKNLEVIKENQRRSEAKRIEQEEREGRIAEIYEIFGRIQTATMFERLGKAASLIWLKEVKDSKVYKGLPGISTWEGFCGRLGMSKKKIDEDLLNLRTFGETFMETLDNLRVGYRDLRKLRHLAADGDIIVSGDTISVGDEQIPLTPESRDDLLEAIQHIEDEKQSQKKKFERRESELKKINQEDAECHKTEVAALVKENRRLKVFDPEAQDDKDLDWAEAQMRELSEAFEIFATMCERIILDPRILDDFRRQAEAEAHLEEAQLRLRNLRKTWMEYFGSDGEFD